jgi:hypothetical protein
MTNGDSTVARLAQAQLPGQIIAWNDVLHEGPTPIDLSLEQLRDVRAQFLASRGWAPYADVLADFASRDTTLAQFQAYDEVVLWFEHDLYDQLQLIQLLDWFAQRPHGDTTLSLICIGAFPGVEPFHGLGQLSSDQLRARYPGRQRVTEAELRLGSAAWKAFCAPDPTAIEAVISGDTSVLPFLKAALMRHLEQFPALDTGLSRTERQILELVGTGIQQPIDLFLADQRREEHPFMGDTTFWWYVQDLGAGPQPLLTRADGCGLRLPAESSSRAEFAAQTLALTEHGQRVVQRQADRLSLKPIDRWLGGVHLQGQQVPWRWDHQHRRIIGGSPALSDGALSRSELD